MSLPATDNFNGGAGPTALTTYSANWTAQLGTFNIISNEGQADSADTSAFWNADVFSNDQYSQFVYRGDSFGARWGPSVRASGTAGSRNNYIFHGAGGGVVWNLYKCVAGAYTLVQAGTTITWASGDVAKLDVVGTNLKAYRNGAQIGITSSDSSLASGSAGLYGSSSSTIRRFDDWEGGDVGGGGINGTLTATLGILAAVATGTVAMSGQAAITLGALTAVSTGTVAMSGALTATLGALTSTSTGTVAMSGAFSQTLGVLTLVSEGVIGTAPLEGQLAKTLGALTVASTGTVAIQGQATATLGALTLVSTGGGAALTINGSLTATLGSLQALSNGTVLISGSLAVTLGVLTSSGAEATVPAFVGADEFFYVPVEDLYLVAR